MTQTIRQIKANLPKDIVFLNERTLQLMTEKLDGVSETMFWQSISTAYWQGRYDSSAESLRSLLESNTVQP